jgi:hypothetical protein
MKIAINKKPVTAIAVHPKTGQRFVETFEVNTAFTATEDEYGSIEVRVREMPLFVQYYSPDNFALAFTTV